MAHVDCQGRQTGTGRRRGGYLFAGTWSQSAVSSHLRALAGELALRGNSAVLVVDKQNRAVENHHENPAVYSWPSPRPIYLRDALFLGKLIRRYRPDCVVGMFGSTNLILLAGWLMGVRCRVAWYLTMAKAIELDSHEAASRRRFQMLRKRLVYRLATHVTPNSSAGSDDAQQVYGIPKAKCHVLYLSLADPTEAMDADVSSRNLQRAICVGRLHPTKGQDVLIRALAQLKHQFPNMVCEFVGDGPRKDECVQLARELGILDRCRFVGQISHQEVLRRMGAAAVSVVPSRSECFGLVNLESLAMGTPIIASDVGGIGEVFRDGEEGFLVPPDDPSALAEHLAMLLRNPSMQAEMSDKARRRFYEFEQGKLVSEQADWFEQIVDSGIPTGKRRT